MPVTDPAMVLRYTAAKIRGRRKYKNMTQEDLAVVMDITRTSIVNIESGRVNIGLMQLVKLADALDCDLRDILPKIR